MAVSWMRSRVWRTAVACLLVGSVVIGVTASRIAATSGRDLVGPAGSESFGIHTLVLSIGNYVVSDPLFDSATLADVGAVYLYNGANQPGDQHPRRSHANDRIGGGVTEVDKSDFVVESRQSNNIAEGILGLPGAITWVNRSTGLDGPVSSANSLVKTGPVDVGI
jgi:trimeric autotransporter adhesin